MKTLRLIGICILFYVVLIAIISIKERENVFKSIAEFFMEWIEFLVGWLIVIKELLPWIIIIIIFLYAISQNY